LRISRSAPLCPFALAKWRGVFPLESVHDITSGCAERSSVIHSTSPVRAMS